MRAGFKNKTKKPNSSIDFPLTTPESGGGYESKAEQVAVKRLSCPSAHRHVTAGLRQAETCLWTQAGVWEGLAGWPGGAAYLGKR